MEHSQSLSANEILELIFVYLTKVSSLRNYDDIIVVLANMGRALSLSERCSVWIVDRDKGEIWTKVAHGINEIRIPVGSGIVGSCISSGEKVIVDDVYKDERFNPEIDKKTGYRTKSMMVIPLFDNNNEIIGAFQAINSKHRSGVFDTRDIQRLMLASTYAAETLLSAKLTNEIEETQKEVIFTMGAIGESRSKETANHVRRVAEYSKILAVAYGMDENEAELLKQASPMHDIGKIGIPDSILKKPGSLNDEEKKVMRTHAELGYNMVKNSQRPLLKAAAIVAYEHHEKYDGSGYPRALKGEQIHIYGRITTVADVFDALSSDRVYKKAWSDEEIFEFFNKEKGKHFDPVLVDIFFQQLDALFRVREMFKDEYAKVETDLAQNSIKVLGAYGTKANGFGTSSFEINKHTVIDAGNLLATLGDKSTLLENIWLTHAHLDHISDIAYIVDNYFATREKTLNIFALPQTIKTLKKCFFNDLIWPDFTKIYLNNTDIPVITYNEISFDKRYVVGKNEYISVFPTDHTIASCGYIYKRDDSSVLITSDTYALENIINIIDSDKSIKSVVVECSFPTSLEKLAKESKHLTPKLLFDALKSLKRDDIRLYINHIKPVYIKEIMQEIDIYSGKWEPKILKDEENIYF